jgi:hypothetical protein
VQLYGKLRIHEFGTSSAGRSRAFVIIGIAGNPAEIVSSRRNDG